MCRGEAKGGCRSAAPKYLPFSDRELQFEKNLTVLAPILTEIGFSNYINYKYCFTLVLRSIEAVRQPEIIPLCDMYKYN